jgi:Ca-activated chloride channel family protein
MRFEAWSAVWLLALLPALGLLYAYGFRRRRQALAAFVENGLAARLLLAGRAPTGWPSAFCLLGATACLVIALMQPHWGQGARPLPLLGRDVIVLLDVSYSMLAEDARPNRLERAKAAIRALVDAVQRRGGDRLGLLAFAGSADVLCPLTRDYGLLLKRLGDASADTVTHRGTAIAAALQAVPREFGELKPGYTDLILVSDGGNHEGDPALVAATLGQQGFRLDTVGLGDPDRSTPIPITESPGRVYLSHDGQEVRTRLESGLLTAMADAAGGTYSALADNSGGLDRLYREQIAGEPRRELTSAASPELADRYRVFLLPAILLLLLEQGLRRSGWTPASDDRKAPAPFWLRPRPRLYASLLMLLPILGSDQAQRAVHEGNLLYGSGQYRAALGKYRAAGAVLPESAAIRFDQGVALFRNRDQDQALDRFLAALPGADRELASRTQYNIGVIKYRQALAAAHDYADALPLAQAAVRAFRASLALDPTQSDARYNLELAYRFQHRVEQHAQSEQRNAQKPAEGASYKHGRAFADLIRNQGQSEREAHPDRNRRARQLPVEQLLGAFASDQDQQAAGTPPPLPPAMDLKAARQLMAELRERYAAAEIERQVERRQQVLEADEPEPW